jgi:hypothetical protein
MPRALDAVPALASEELPQGPGSVSRMEGKMIGFGGSLPCPQPDGKVSANVKSTVVQTSPPFWRCYFCRPSFGFLR